MRGLDSKDHRLDLAALFGNANPVEADLGCGKGAFLVSEAAARPEVNFLGVDYLTRKIERSLREVRERDLLNVRFFRCDVFQFVDRILPTESISTFHIYFPDPWPKKRHRRRRFMSGAFITSLSRALVPVGKVWLFTDHLDYFEYVDRCFQEEPAFQTLIDPKPPAKGTTNFEAEFIAAGRIFYRMGCIKVGPPAFPLR